MTIRHVRDVIRFHGTHSPDGFPFEFWRALNEHDRLVMLALADWLEEHEDLAFAAAWRTLYLSGREPLNRGAYDSHWLREGDTMDRSFLGYAWQDERLRIAAKLPAAVFDVMLATCSTGYVQAEYFVPARGPYHYTAVGRANAMTNAATAFALVAAGHTVRLKDENGLVPVWSVPVRYQEVK